MTLGSVPEKFASFFQIFNFLKFFAAYRCCFPLNTKQSVTEFIIPLHYSPVGTKLSLLFLSNVKFSFEEEAKIREILLTGFSSQVYASYTDSHYQFCERSVSSYTY